MNESHGALLVLFHVQAGPVVTLTAGSVAPIAAADIEFGDTLNEHNAADCVTVRTCPAIDTTPTRSAPAFAANESDTLPFPLPAPPEGIVIHGVELCAVQEQPVATCTATGGDDPPALDSVSADG